MFIGQVTNIGLVYFFIFLNAWILVPAVLSPSFDQPLPGKELPKVQQKLSNKVTFTDYVM